MQNLEADPEPKTISRQNLIAMCQISEGEFTRLLEEENITKGLRIYEIQNGQFCLMGQAALYDLLDDLLVLLNAMPGIDPTRPTVTLSQIESANNGIVKSKYTQRDIDFAMRHLSEEVQTSGEYRLSLPRI